MSEIRLNILSGDWTIIASERSKKPQDFHKPKQEESAQAYQKDCPFCPGNEGVFVNTETFRIGDSNAWQVKSIYNKYPALSPDKNPARTVEGLNNVIGGFGAHEVIIEHPRHDLTISLMTDQEILNIIKAYKSRYESLIGIKGIEAVTIFKNQGPGAGASLRHPHSQIVATPIVPPMTRVRLDNAARHFDTTGKCIFCQMLNGELADKKRIICETEKFVSFVPFAAAAPFIIWIFPRRHMASFADIDASEMSGMAFVLKMLYRASTTDWEIRISIILYAQLQLMMEAKNISIGICRLCHAYRSRPALSLVQEYLLMRLCPKNAQNF